MALMSQRSQGLPRVSCSQAALIGHFTAYKACCVFLSSSKRWLKKPRKVRANKGTPHEPAAHIVAKEPCRSNASAPNWTLAILECAGLAGLHCLLSHKLYVSRNVLFALKIETLLKLSRSWQSCFHVKETSKGMMAQWWSRRVCCCGMMLTMRNYK